MNDDASPEVTAAATIGGVLTDLVQLAERLPVPPDHAERTAQILDRLAAEISEAAAMLRALSPDREDETERLSAAFPDWRIAFAGGADWAGFTASRAGYCRISAETAALLEARLKLADAGSDPATSWPQGNTL